MFSKAYFMYSSGNESTEKWVSKTWKLIGHECCLSSLGAPPQLKTFCRFNGSRKASHCSVASFCLSRRLTKPLPKPAGSNAKQSFLPRMAILVPLSMWKCHPVPIEPPLLIHQRLSVVTMARLAVTSCSSFSSSSVAFMAS